MYGLWGRSGEPSTVGFVGKQTPNRERRICDRPEAGRTNVGAGAGLEGYDTTAAKGKARM